MQHAPAAVGKAAYALEQRITKGASGVREVSFHSIPFPERTHTRRLQTSIGCVVNHHRRDNP